MGKGSGESDGRNQMHSQHSLTQPRSFVVVVKEGSSLGAAWAEYLRSRGHTVDICSTVDPAWHTTPPVYDGCINLVNGPDIDTTSFGETVQFIADAGIPLLNDLSVSYVAANKLQTHDVWHQHDLPQPASYPFGYQYWRGPMVVKPIRGWKGRDVHRVETFEEAWEIAGDAPKEWMLQEIIPNPTVVRIIATPNECITSYAKTAPQGVFVASINNGAVRVPYDINEADADLAQRSVAALGGTVMGVDLLISEEGERYLLETNEYFGWDATDTELAASIMSVVERRFSDIDR